MSVLIKGMEMPKSCGVCKFFAWKRGVGQYCAVDDRITFHATIDGFEVGYERNGSCPLVPVPKHGRLIDADAELKRIKNCMFPSDMVTTMAVSMYEKWLNNAPTVIEAEEGER